MDGIIILLVFALIVFAIITFTRRFNDSFILIAFAIGLAVNANYYHSGNYPVQVGSMIISIDAILYSAFMYTIVVKYIHYPKKEGHNVVWATLAAIIIAAIIECVARSSVKDKTPLQVIEIFGNYFFSALGTFIACLSVSKLVEVFEDKHISRYVTILVGMIIGSLINTVIFFGGQLAMTAIDGTLTNDSLLKIGQSVLGNTVFKIIAIAFAELAYMVNVKWWVPKELLKREDVRR